MKTWTVLVAQGRKPELIPEGFSFWAFVFGPFWFAANGAWIFAGLALALDIATSRFAPPGVSLVVSIAFGVFGNDLRRLALEWRGYDLAHVIAASTFDGAIGRLLAVRPDLIADAAA